MISMIHDRSTENYKKVKLMDIYHKEHQQWKQYGKQFIKFHITYCNYEWDIKDIKKTKGFRMGPKGYNIICFADDKHLIPENNLQILYSSFHIVTKYLTITSE